MTGRVLDSVLELPKVVSERQSMEQRHGRNGHQRPSAGSCDGDASLASWLAFPSIMNALMDGLFVLMNLNWYGENEENK